MSGGGRNLPIWTVLLPLGKKKGFFSFLSKQHILEDASIFPQNGPEGNEKNIRTTAEKKKILSTEQC